MERLNWIVLFVIVNMFGLINTVNALPDLTMQAPFDFAPMTVFAGDSITLNFVVSNIGDVDADSFITGFVASVDVLGIEIIAFCASTPITLDAGFFIMDSCTMDIPFDAEPGYYYIIIYIDGYFDVDESNELNNVFYDNINFLAVYNATSDIDTDDVLDEDEIFWFGDLETSTGSTDFDGDNYDDRTEIDKGTDPTDPADHPKTGGGKSGCSLNNQNYSFFEIILFVLVLSVIAIRNTNLHEQRKRLTTK